MILRKIVDIKSSLNRSYIYKRSIFVPHRTPRYNRLYMRESMDLLAYAQACPDSLYQNVSHLVLGQLFMGRREYSSKKKMICLCQLGQVCYFDVFLWIHWCVLAFERICIIIGCSSMSKDRNSIQLFFLKKKSRTSPKQTKVGQQTSAPGPLNSNVTSQLQFGTRRQCVADAERAAGQGPRPHCRPPRRSRLHDEIINLGM